MNEQILKRCISKEAISFVLENESVFNYAGFKVIRNEEESRFINPGRLLHNGKTKLIYNISKYKPLSLLLENMDSEKYAQIICGIYDSIKSLNSNGFIKIENTIINNEEIFIDVKRNSVHLICLPLTEHVIYMNKEELYKGFKNNILETIKKYKHLESPIINQLIDNLKEGTLKTINFEEETKIEEVIIEDNNKTEIKKASLFGKIFNRSKKTSAKEEAKELNYIKLESLDLDRQIILNINKDTYTIGKQDNLVDGVISDNTISRIHCKITKKNNQYYITDLGSLNGTYVNNKRNTENNMVPINKGDIIKISRINFVVK